MIRRVILAAFLFFAGTAAAHADGTCDPSSTGIAFGRFSGSQATIIGSITLICTGKGTFDYEVTLSTGQSRNFRTREMTNGLRSLSYNLYTDPAFTQIWGTGSRPSGTVTGTVQMNDQPLQIVHLSVYAKLPEQRPPASLIYADAIVALVTTSQGVRAGPFPVTALILPACVVSATNLVFGLYTGAQLDGQSQISLTCNEDVAWNVGLSAGDFPGVTVNNRKMAGPGLASLPYALYRDAARTLNWGNRIDRDTVSGTGTGSVQTLNVYGRIPASRSEAPGGYQDTIIVTVDF